MEKNGKDRPYIAKLIGAVATLVMAMFVLGAGSGSVAWADSGSTGETSVNTSVYGQAPVSLHDFAKLASLTVTRTGPADVTYTKDELRHNTPLVGSDKWHGFDQQSGRNIEINLPVDVAVYQVSIDMEQVPHIGVHYPASVDFEVEQNGTWYVADKVPTKIATWNKQNTHETFKANFGNIDAKHIIIHFPVAGWVFARQIHVWGVNASQAQPAQNLTLPSVQKTYSAAMTTSDPRDNGIQNMLLVYNDGLTTDGTWTVHDFLPMVGFMTQRGAIQHRMFDTMLFLPTGHLENTQASWYGFLSNLFSAGTQLSALNTAVGQVNDALAASDPNAENFQEKVVIALPYPVVGKGVWGQVDGKNVKFSGGPGDWGAVQARSTALRWYIQTLENAWQGAGLTHLKLAGFYWLSEKVNFQNPDDPQLIQEASQITADFGLPLLWIPYYDAAGIDNWQSEGFNAAWLQSHYLVGNHPDLHRLSNAIQLTKDEGMGFEVEANWKEVVNPTFRAVYENMLSTLERNGMAGNVSHAYYAGSKVYVRAAYSGNGAEYGLYKNTYEFMQHS